MKHLIPIIFLLISATAYSAPKDSAAVELNEVEISSRRNDANVKELSMSSQKLPILAIKKMPALLGEVDIIKSIQLLPGVQAAAEGTSGFSVRGGNTDQNLILLDDAAIYNASHLMGFFSVFNNEVVEDATLYKGDIPAIYGGRLSSVLDVSTKKPNAEKFKGSGGIGLISSRLTLETPIIKEKLSAYVSGRRTYADLFLPLAPNEDIRNNTLYFYDLNAKINYDIDAKNRVFVSGYWGRDKFGAQGLAGLDFGNGAAVARWNHLFSNTFFMNASLIYTQYSYALDMAMNEFGINWTSRVNDYTAKVDFVKLFGEKSKLRFGANGTYHYFKPGEIKNTGKSQIINDTVFNAQDAGEYAVYASNEHNIIDNLLSVKYGIRGTAFRNGKTYFTAEPRIGAVLLLPRIKSSVKAAYSHTTQNLLLGSNATGGTPFDVWYPINPNIKPQQSNQYTAGFFHNFFDNRLETSVELYYKTISDLIDFKDNPDFMGNASHIETEILTGKGRSYGAEFLFRKSTGALTGWISYTYSHSYRTVAGINFGNEYRSPFDRPHNFVAVLSWDINKFVNISANWIYNTGQPVTYPTGKMWYGNRLIPVFSGERNNYRFPDYHRLDLSATVKCRKRKYWQGEWNFSLYNAYARKNVWAVMFIQSSEKPDELQTKMLYLFSVVPSVTYNFYF
ncbi:MAG: TonB-dependent receptor plug domain-containing protein [Prevotellaceae bacterium]|nr:TonB-dependent receptor plug domain-containing protein [Prevotellaceae bacterium]